MLSEGGKGPHYEVDILVFELLDYVKICLLRCGHAGMAESSCDAGDRDAGEQQNRSMGVPQSVNRDNGDSGLLAPACQDAVHCGVVHFPAGEQRGGFRRIPHELGELDNELPIKRDFPHRRRILCRGEPAFSFIIPGFAHGQHLAREVEIAWRERERLGKPQTSFCDKQDKPVPVDGLA